MPLVGESLGKSHFKAAIRRQDAGVPFETRSLEFSNPQAIQRKYPLVLLSIVAWVFPAAATKGNRSNLGNTFMDTHSDPRILSTEKYENAVLVTFEDGQCALYSASLLHATLPQAEQLAQQDKDLEY